MEVNPDRKFRLEPRRWLDVNTDNHPATPATKSASNLIICIPLVLVNTDESEELCGLGSTRPSYIITLERSASQ